MFKFVTANTGHGPKRLQAQRACEPCRKRKKRCGHYPSPRSSHTEVHGPIDKNSTPRPTPSAARDNAPSASYQSEPVGQKQSDDLQSAQISSGELPSANPQGRRSESLEGNEIQPQQDVGLPQPTSGPEGLGWRFIGDLSPEGIFLAATSPDAIHGVSSSDSVGVWLNTALKNGASQATSAVLPVQSQSSLFYGSSALLQKVLLPVLEQECLSAMPPPPDFDALSKIYFEKVHPIFPVLDEDAFRVLGPTEPSRIILQQAICLAASKNSAAAPYLILTDSVRPLSYREFGDRVAAAMRLSIEMGLITDRIVLIQALALMSQFMDSQDGSDLSSQLCGRAVHHIHSMGLHVKCLPDEDQNRYSTTLLCCIWVIDKMNAAFYGRPVLMHDRDFGRDMEQCILQQEPCFRLLLHVTQLLDKVIGLYRPSHNSTDSVLDDQFLSFEELVANCGAAQIATSLLATIEILYHAVAILSCRSNTRTNRQLSSTSYLRRSLSCLRLSSTFGRDVREKLILFPFIPYAVSLALSIAYHEMRHDKIPMYRARARAQFQASCDFLSDLGHVFWSASSTSEMGKKILKEMDRVFSAVSDTGNHRQQQQGLGNRGIVNAGSSLSMSDGLENPQANTVTTNGVQTPNYPIQDFDPSIFDSMPDLDIFGMFDPDFDLNGIDACLEGILDPSFPVYPQ